MNPKYAFLLAALITLLIAADVFLISHVKDSVRREITISRVIDGDTIVTENGETLRLANINAFEKGEKGYEEAKSFLSSFENQTAEIEELGTDRYGRILVRLFNQEYLNLELVKKGYANKYLVQAPELRDFESAENLAIESALGIWELSPLYNCFTASIDPSKELVILKSKCGEINISGFLIKDESRKKYNFQELVIIEIKIHSESGENNSTDVFWNSENVWNNDRDTLYFFDANGKIVHHESYGY